jgi:hypothetical protein
LKQWVVVGDCEVPDPCFSVVRAALEAFEEFDQGFVVGDLDLETIFGDEGEDAFYSVRGEVVAGRGRLVLTDVGQIFGLIWGRF